MVVAGFFSKSAVTLSPQEIADRVGRDLSPRAAFKAAMALDNESRLDAAGRIFSAGFPDIARRLLEKSDPSGDQAAHPGNRAAWLGYWFGRDHYVPSPARPGVPRLAVIDYRHGTRELASINVGDNVQTLAMLGNIVGIPGVKFGGDPGLVEIANDLKARRIDLDSDADEVELDLAVIQRDFSTNDLVTEPTWLLAYGWYMWPQHADRFAFPFHSAIRPLFMSFHCNDPRMLTPAALDYLRTHGPIGCRDWSTVRLLLDNDVPAFFTGCVTSTLGHVVRHTPSKKKRPIAYVEAEDPTGVGTEVTQVDSDMLSRTHEASLRTALALLDRYSSEFSSVVTSRLHCYLPSRAMGTPVTFTPLDPSDIRFDGLANLTDDEFAAMAQGVSELASAALGWIVAGLSESEVYANWRERVAPLMEQSRAKIAAA